MKADVENTLKPRKFSVSSKKVFLSGFNVTEESEEWSPVSQTSNVSPCVSCQSVMSSTCCVVTLCLISNPNVQVLYCLR
jgi:hypothetical protein